MAGEPPLPDVAIVGLGPAGRALAHRCLLRGLDVLVVDNSPDRVWAPTYAAWEDELPEWLDRSSVASRVPYPAVRAGRPRTLGRTYCVFDTRTLQSILNISKAHIVAGRAVLLATDAVVLENGTVLHARYVVDARGTETRGAARQTAYGVFLDRASAAPALEGRTSWFMDWQGDNGADSSEQPSFLYAVPTGPDRVLLEETCLVGSPPLSVRVLRERLLHRLEARGITVPDGAEIEVVNFVVEPSARHGKSLAFGARGGLIHPGTGYSVAASLALADRMSAALADGTVSGSTVWPLPARAVAALRMAGLRVLLDLDTSNAGDFFEAFFTSPPGQQRAYLSSRADTRRTLAAMWSVFRRSPTRLRYTIVRAVFRRHRP
ncbi:lycopene cyclase family protein [Rhodococcus sp. NPDC058521]|uniref:lycopene cyclase family protein n=1 Tax=Rhodococcus sp. NPDC058521 TaxID=3346536 RepID=UPI003666371E